MSGVLVAWADPPVPIDRNYNPNDPLQQSNKAANELKMELVYLLPFLKFLGKND